MRGVTYLDSHHLMPLQRQTLPPLHSWILHASSYRNMRPRHQNSNQQPNPQNPQMLTMMPMPVAQKTTCSPTKDTSSKPSAPPLDDTVHENVVHLTHDLLYVIELVKAVSDGDFG